MLLNISSLSPVTTTCSGGQYSVYTDVSVLADGASLVITADHDTSLGVSADQAQAFVLKDTVSPLLSFSPTPEMIDSSNEKNYSFSGTCSEDVTIDIEVGTLETSTLCTAGAFVSLGLNLSGLAAGTSYVVTLIAKDEVGNTTTISEIVAKDIDFVDDDHSLTGFGGGIHSGTSMNSENMLSLSSEFNMQKLDQSWVNEYSALKAYWRFDEEIWAGDFDILDSTDHNLHLKVNGNTQQTTLAKVGSKAARFVDTTSDLIFGSDYEDQDDNWTLSFWVKPSATTYLTSQSNSGTTCFSNRTSNRTIVIPHTNGLSSTSITYIGISVGTNGLSLCEHKSGFMPYVLTHSIAMTDWNFVTVVSTNGVIDLYLNGTFIKSAASSVNTRRIRLSRLGASSMTNYGSFLGDVDEFSIWSEPLSSSTISQIYQLQSPRYSGQFTSRVMSVFNTTNIWDGLKVKTPLPFGKELTGDVDNDGIADPETRADYSFSLESLSDNLVGLWHFNGNGNDSSGNSNHALSINGSTVSEDSLFDKSYYFDNTDVINLGTLGDFGSLLHSFSSSIWIKTSDKSGMGAFYKVIESSNSMVLSLESNRSLSSGCNLVENSGKTLFYLRDSAGNILARYVDYDIYDNKWHNIVVSIHDSSLNSFKIYIDGIEVTLLGSCNQSPSSFANLTQFIAVGASNNRGTLEGHQTGYIDEFALWKRALSEEEVIQVYRRGVNRLKYQVRTCDDADCIGEPWVGPDGSTQTYFSELHNKALSGVYSANGVVQTQSLSLAFKDFVSLNPNSYFQYRVIMESDDHSNLCSAGPCMPSVERVEVLY